VRCSSAGHGQDQLRPGGIKPTVAHDPKRDLFRVDSFSPLARRRMSSARRVCSPMARPVGAWRAELRPDKFRHGVRRKQQQYLVNVLQGIAQAPELLLGPLNLAVDLGPLGD
jgi:hypothetical protein